MLTTEIVLVRHGETVGQSSIRLHGATDVPLDALGHHQMRCVRRALEKEHFDDVVTSPLVRCRHAASIVRPGAPLVVCDGFREIDFGAWEGLTWREIASRDPEAYNAWRTQGPAFHFPAGESRPAFRARVARQARDVMAKNGPKVLAILHKGVIKILIGELLALDQDEASQLGVDLASIHRMRRIDDRWQLVVSNATAHLEKIADEP